MFLATVYCSLLLLKIGFCVQDNTVNQKGDFQPEVVPSPAEFNNKTVFTDSNRMNKIVSVKNGTVVKSAFVPAGSSDNVSVNVTEVGKRPKHLPEEKFVIKNGKKYRIVKLKKNAGNADKTQRSFNIFPKLSSIIPVKWMTKGQKEMDSEVLPPDNEWSILTSSENVKRNLTNNSKRIYNSEKIQKLLSLFTIVKFDNGNCYADGIKGTCLHRIECEDKGGKFTTNCAGELGVCCYFERTCGEVSKENCTYFVNKGFPDSSTTAPKICILTIEKSHPNIKQLRLDFLVFQLKGPTNGTCIHDRLVISGLDNSDNIPDICGANTGQHIYINMEDSNGPYNLNIITVGEYFHRNFRIKVTQMEQRDLLLAPKNCLQYYSEPTGYVQTFNYQHKENLNAGEIYNGYFNNLNYAICIKKLKGFCSISYENEEVESVHPSFQLTNVDEDGERLLPPNQAGAETFDCPDDYISVNGIRLCGEKLNDGTAEMDYTKNYPVTDTSNGPFLLSVKTDAAVSGRGFYLKYTQHPCIV